MRKGLAVIILAAGKGTRMTPSPVSFAEREPIAKRSLETGDGVKSSALPKALHTLCGKSMLWHGVQKALLLRPWKTFVVVGHRKDLVEKELPSGVVSIWQKKQLGSGHAVDQARHALSGFKGRVLVLYCDTPLIPTSLLRELLDDQARTGADCSLLSAELKNPYGYGRILRKGLGRVSRIVEENDATPREKRLAEVNVGCYVFRSKKLFQALECVRQNPVKKEVYLTDAIEVLGRGGKVSPVLTKSADCTLGVNTRRDLARIQALMQNDILNSWVDKGVVIRDPRTTTIDADVRIGEGTVILPHSVLEEGSRIGKDCRIGPFARIRGGSQIAQGAVIGNFVEVVRSSVGARSQIKHLSYIGDAQIGRDVNVGAGTITANYDGKNKHRTVIKDKAQIGSGTIFIAPVTVGRGAKTGAGAVVTKGTKIKDRSTVVGVPAKHMRGVRFGG